MANAQSEIEIVNIKLFDRPPLRAIVEVEIRGITTRAWRVVKWNGQKAQIQAPQATWRGQDGRIHYEDLVSLVGELRQRIDAQILVAYEEEIKRNGSHHS